MKQVLRAGFCPCMLAGMLLVSLGAQAQKTLRGDGQIRTEDRPVSNFTAIRSGGSFQLVITEGNSPAVQVETDGNLLPYVETKVAAGRLRVETANGVNLKPSQKIIVRLTVKQLDRLDLSGSCEVKSTNTLEMGHMRMNISGSSSITLDGNASSVEAHVSGTTHLCLRGKARSASYHISGTGEVEAADLVTEGTEINISGIGNLHVNATQTLAVSVSGMGKVKYKGDPRVSQHVSGMGSVSRE